VPESVSNSSDIVFSKHANNRMMSRGLEVNAQDQARLETAVDELSQRGAKESLVLMDDRAYVVGVPKRTVITVMSREEAMGQVFTNIDSTYVSM
jgi:flagellar operon protein